MVENHDLLFELGTEELPPKSLSKLSNGLRENVAALLEENHLGFATIRAFATPRRLALLVADLESSQPDTSQARKGPAVSAAFDNEGKPTKAAQGFARSCGTTVDQLERENTDKGEWLFFRKEVQGARSESLIPSIINKSLLKLPIAKRMRWGSGTTEFVRPVHWSTLLYGNQVITAEILGTSTGNLTYGHRFHAPEAIQIDQPNSYEDLLYKNGKVIADFTRRRETILNQVNKAANELDVIPLVEHDLLDEVTALVEWPVAITGNFEARFLNLPSEVLITTMQANQKYFPLVTKSEKLYPSFITISNIESSNPDTVRKGNERVIRPRLEDAEFFWTQDRKSTLENRISALGEIIFQKKLGTLAAKSDRVTKLAELIANQLNVDATDSVRAARLAKADLVTDMVGEFPSLQGIMGRYYAEDDGENEEVANAIEEQYMPKQSGGVLPETHTGQILSIAEKLDTLTGIFSAGMIPTGDKDPYALRRSTLGMLRIVIEKRLNLDIFTLLQSALDTIPKALRNDSCYTELSNFIHDRLRGYCLERGFKADEFDAVLSVGTRRPLDFEKRLLAVAEFRSLEAAKSLAAANKRIRNILRKSGTEIVDRVDPKHFSEEEEKNLFQEMQAAAKAIDPMLRQDDYTAALSRLSSLRETVDNFFDKVMVMANDPVIRDNRLALLAEMQSLFLRIADISKLQ